MCDCTCKYKNAKERQRYYEGIEISVVPSAHAITNPWTVMIKSLCKKNIFKVS